MIYWEGPIIYLDDGDGGIPIPLDALVEAIIILSVGVLIIVTNVIIIATFITYPGKKLRCHCHSLIISTEKYRVISIRFQIPAPPTAPRPTTRTPCAC